MQGILQVKNNEQIESEERAKALALHGQLSAPQNTAPMDALAQHLRKGWADAREAKRVHEADMLAALRQRKGEYEARLESNLRSVGASEVFLRLTDAKCRAAKAWIDDVLFNAGEKPWTIDPTPVPTLPQDAEQRMKEMGAQLASSGMYLPEEVMQMLAEAEPQVLETLRKESSSKAEAMARTIDDQFIEGSFKSALNESIEDFVTHKAAFILGPITKRMRQLKWQNGKPAVIDALVTTWRRLSPLDVYPSPIATSVEDGDMYVHERYNPNDFWSLHGLPGVRSDMIDYVMQEYSQKGLTGWLDIFGEQEKDRAEGRYYKTFSSQQTVDVLRFMGTVTGLMLAQWGMEGVEPSSRPYQVEALLVNNWVIRVRLNHDPLGRKALFKCCAFPVPGSFWGQTLPYLMEDVQELINTAGRALDENMSMASGPQVGIDMAVVETGADVSNIRPWHVWKLNTRDRMSASSAGGLPLVFFQPDMHAAQLLGIMSDLAIWADTVTGIPAYMSGDSVTGGAADTASGLSMLLGNAAKGIREMLMSIGAMVEQIVERQYAYNMLYHPDESIKGDSQVKAGAFMALLQRETRQLRRKELLDSTNNPTDMQIIGLAGRAELLRQVIKGAEIDAEKVVPNSEEILAMQQASLVGPVGPGVSTPDQPQSGEGVRVADGMAA